MNTRGAKRCEFCNSASHTMHRCNSNMNGHKDDLDKGWSCMMDPTCPKFEMLRANELRYIAYHYAQYEKTRFIVQTKKQLNTITKNLDCDRFHCRFQKNR